VPEHHSAGLGTGTTGDLVGQPNADTTEAFVAESVDLRGGEQLRAALRYCTFGNHDDRGVFPLEAADDPLAHPIQGERLFRHQDHVRPAGHPGVQGDPARAAAHHLDNRRPVVRFRGGAQPVDRLGGDVHRGVEPERVVGGAQIVVDGLGHSHHENPVVAQPFGYPEGVFTADCD
jgi:hypothetical protein